MLKMRHAGWTRGGNLADALSFSFEVEGHSLQILDYYRCAKTEKGGGDGVVKPRCDVLTCLCHRVCYRCLWHVPPVIRNLLPTYFGSAIGVSDEEWLGHDLSWRVDKINHKWALLKKRIESQVRGLVGGWVASLVAVNMLGVRNGRAG